MKSAADIADPAGMPVLAMASDVPPEVFACTAIIAAGVALAALRIIAANMDYARRYATLMDQARALRERQMERLRNLRPRR